MTIDSITAAAHTEAAYRDMDPGKHGENNRAWFVAGAMWGHDQALAQEATEELLDYVAAAISECDGIYFQDCIRRNPGIAQMYRRQARAALTAARRYEENR